MEKRTKVLFAITKSNWGGAQRYVFDLAAALPLDRFEPVVLLGGAGTLKSRLEEKGVRVIALPALGRDVSIVKDIGIFFRLMRIFRTERPAVVHLNSSKIGALGALAARASGARRIIFTAHGWAFNEARPAWQKAAIKIIYWITMLLSSRTIVVSQAMRKQVDSFPFVQKKIVVIHNGIAPFALAPRAQARAALALPSDLPSIGVLAELHHIKGLDVLIDAAAILQQRGNEFRIVIMGEGEERAHLETQIKRLGLEQTVHLPGHVPEARSHLSAFDIFALPSRSEALSFALIEARLAALPVVASNVGGIPEVIENGKSGILVPPGDAKALADALEKLLSDPNLRQHLGASLKERVEKEFSFERMAEQTIALY